MSTIIAVTLANSRELDIWLSPNPAMFKVIGKRKVEDRTRQKFGRFSHHEIAAVDSEVPVVGSSGSVIVFSKGLFVGRSFVGSNTIKHGASLGHISVVHDGHRVKSKVLAFLRPSQTCNTNVMNQKSSLSMP